MFTVLYADTVKMGDRITPLLGTSPFERADTWGWWREALRRADVGIAAVRELGHEETRRLRAPANGSIADPPCVVVVPLSIGSVQRRRSFDPVRLRVVWLEELEDRLPRVLRELRGAHGNPLRSLGERIIAEHRPRLVVTKAVSHICNVGDARQSPPPPPPISVARLAQSLYISPSPLRRYWAADVPLRCGPKQLLKWALLLWAIERRAGGEPWRTVTRSAETTRRTLQRHARELAGCGLAAAVRSPDAVRLSFKAWVGRMENGP